MSIPGSRTGKALDEQFPWRLLALLLSFLPIALFAQSPIVELSESGTDPGSSTPVNPPVSVPLPRYHELSVYSGRRSDTR